MKLSNTVNQLLLDWYQTQKRDLPFRKTKDPYKIWISEIMAQQTRMDTLLPYYERFIEQFPTVKALAEAKEESVLKAWEGLGYYSRAKNLHKAARQIAAQGTFPKTYFELMKLPGIGAYTAGAISSIAFNETAAAVDGNVLRVMSRIYLSYRDIMENATRKLLKEEIEQTLPEDRSSYTQSLMELGALVCTPKNPSCLICPVRPLCKAYQEGETEALPVKKSKKKPKRITQEAYILTNENRLYLQKRENGKLLAGLWGVPVLEKETIKQSRLPVSKHIFSHVIWESHLVEISENAEEFIQKNQFDGEWIEFGAITEKSIPTAFQKILALSSVNKYINPNMS